MNRFTFIIITFIRSIKKKKVVIVSEAFKASGKIASFTSGTSPRDQAEKGFSGYC